MASAELDFLQQLERYTEDIDGSAEPDRIPYSAAAYTAMTMHKSIMENIARLRDQGTEHGSGGELGIASIGAGSGSESESSDLRLVVCAELSQQDELGYQDLEAMAQIFFTSEEKRLDMQKQKVEEYRKSLEQADLDKFDSEVQKFRSSMGYSQTDYLRFSREMPEDFLALTKHICR